VTDRAVVDTFHAPDGTRLAVHEIGQGPALICVPGGPGRASAYLEDLAGLAELHTLLRLDMRGTGRSELPEDRDSLRFPRLADDIEALRIERGLDRIDLLGHSAGCFVSLVYAARYPTRVARLVLVTPSGRGFGEVDDDIARIRESRADEPWYAEVAAIQAEAALLPPHRRSQFDRDLRPFAYGTWSERARAHAASTDSQMSLRATAGFAPEDLRAEAEAALAGIADFAGPALIIVGDRDGLTGTRAGSLVARLLGDSRVVELAGAGHYPWVDVPTAFRHTVAEFLDA
jgi:pimeloyl-ACP methyl ester carboxylesterase